MKNTTQNGSVLVAAAGLAAILACLALTFFMKTRSQSDLANAFLHQAQARIMLSSAIVYLCQNGAPATALRIDANNGNDPATYNLAWFRIASMPATDPVVGGYAPPVLLPNPATATSNIVLTTGSGLSLGYRDWADVTGAGATSSFGNSPLQFGDCTRNEVRNFYVANLNGSFLASLTPCTISRPLTY